MISNTNNLQLYSIKLSFLFNNFLKVIIIILSKHLWLHVMIVCLFYFTVYQHFSGHFD